MKKKTILFIADKPDWAYHNIVKCWQEELSLDYEVYIAFAEDFLMNFKSTNAITRILLNTANHFRNRDKNYLVDKSGCFSSPIYKSSKIYRVSDMQPADIKCFDIMVELAYYFQYISKFPFKTNKKIVGIYTDSFPHEGPTENKLRGINTKNLSREDFFKTYLKPYDGILVGSQNLYNDYRKLTDKLVFANGIYKQNEFKENKNIGKQEFLTVGWTGNPNRPMKGFKEVIEPAVNLVQETGRDIRVKTRFSGDYDGLLGFYTDVDVVAIASDADTGPSLFSEASLSSVPSISTKIGFPKMVIKHNENGYFINRNIEELKDALIKVYDDRNLLKQWASRIKNDYLTIMNNEIFISNLKTFLEEL